MKPWRVVIIVVAIWVPAAFISGYSAGSSNAALQKKSDFKLLKESFDKMASANASNEQSLKTCVAGWNNTIADLNRSTAVLNQTTKAIRDSIK